MARGLGRAGQLQWRVGWAGQASCSGAAGNAEPHVQQICRSLTWNMASPWNIRLTAAHTMPSAKGCRARMQHKSAGRRPLGQRRVRAPCALLHLLVDGGSNSLHLHALAGGCRTELAALQLAIDAQL